MSWLYWAICLMFLLFAGWQYNDPDPWLWGPIYGFVALVYGMAAMGKSLPRRVLWAAIGLLGAFSAFYLPDFWNWLQMGSPSITETMKAEQPWVEFTREFLGLLICILALGWRLYIPKKNPG
jgi:Transmembrane family 220, helix